MSIMTLWQPILATTVLAFIAGSVIWMAMPWHKNDWQQPPDEDGARRGLNGLTPGQYSLPHVKGMADFKNPEIQQKYKDGPVAFITVLPSRLPNMGPNMVLMALFNLLVAVLCAYFVSRLAPAGADYMTIFRISSAVTFISYGMAYVQESVWFGRPWSATMKTFLDAAIYAGITGGVFGWLT
jgi:hypothetical protein